MIIRTTDALSTRICFHRDRLPCHPWRVGSVAPSAAALVVPHAFASVLRERPYRRLWFSGLCVNGARRMDLVLLGWLAFQP